MTQNEMEHLFREYVAGWLLNEPQRVLNVLDPHCVVIESHGPKYDGVNQIERWINDWIDRGHSIITWNIQSGYFDHELNSACLKRR
jgi:uncharacterized protein (DUF488 family)